MHFGIISTDLICWCNNQGVLDDSHSTTNNIINILLYIFIDSSKDTTMIEYLWAVLQSNEHYVTDVVASASPQRILLTAFV